MMQQRGGTFLGMIFGLVIGLGIALAVAVYVTKVPIPFVNKGQSRSAEQDAAEAKKNKDWDPNAPLYGKNPAKPAVPASAPPAVAEEAASAPARVVTTPAEADPKVGAYRTTEDAEAHRAKLSLAGVEAKVSEREQSGRKVFRVRVGPMEKRDDADRTKEKLEALGMEAVLVRVQR